MGRSPSAASVSSPSSTGKRAGRGRQGRSWGRQRGGCPRPRACEGLLKPALLAARGKHGGRQSAAAATGAGQGLAGAGPSCDSTPSKRPARVASRAAARDADASALAVEEDCGAAVRRGASRDRRCEACARSWCASQVAEHPPLAEHVGMDGQHHGVVASATPPSDEP